jgi:putative flippase GtrA
VDPAMTDYKKFATDLWSKHQAVLLWAVGGGINTVFTYGLYLLFNLVFSYRIAFTVSYVIGIVFAYFFNSLVVFKTPISIKKFVQFPAVYLVQYLLNIGLLEVFVQVLNISDNLAPIFVLIIITPVTYLLSKLILQEKNISGAEHND